MKPETKEKILSIIVGIINLLILIMLIIWVINAIEPTHLPCDYDSCSQQIYKWNYTGSKCFENSPECSDFLRLWDACQEWKKDKGVC